MNCSCVWLVVGVAAHNFHVECGSLGAGGGYHIYICIYIYTCVMTNVIVVVLLCYYYYCCFKFFLHTGS